MNESDFIKHYIANAGQFMWFLGAGTSRTAGMPTAVDLIWDLKLKYYCREENQDIKAHDINNENIKNRIQSYMDSKGFPKLWSPEEYSFYFELTFGTDYDSQQKYLAEQLANTKISLNIGHRALAGLVKLNKARIIFTTNFDEVIETACVKVAETTLTTFNLEGSYAALAALNAERFPFYAKVHGDFKYRSVKNLSQDLISNDVEIQKCLIAASARYGLIVSGYSGRDANVMAMFSEAIQQHNAFPVGLIWTVPSTKNILPAVTDLISAAQAKGIKAHIVEAGPFDSMMSKIWRQLTDRNIEVDSKVNTVTTKDVKIPIGVAGNSFPILRTNALPITSLPKHCAVIETKTVLSGHDIKELLMKNHSRAIVSRTESVLAWGTEEDIMKALGAENIQSVSVHTLDNPGELIVANTGYHAFFERALAISLCDQRPITMKNDRGFVLTVLPKDANNPIFQPLKEALTDRNGNLGSITGSVGYSSTATWSESVSIKLETRNGNCFIMLKPSIWIEPHAERRNQIEFVRGKRRYRYNPTTSKILDAWIKILFGTVGKNETEVTCFKDSKYAATFKVNTRTAFSRR